ncbi:hypothetical protein B0H13DRAFT_2333788 [Mycena leptocephala]|nr:hypothetical protein B0H13DRAFT_2333788 [Mycena leptocephala]
MPSSLKATLPSPTLPVTEFLALELPAVDKKSKPPTQTKRWFSTDSPNCDHITTLGSSKKSLPPLYLLRELQNDLPQQWLNGIQSVLDPLNKSLRLPLFAITFYIEIHALRNAQEKWQNSMDWVRENFPAKNLEPFVSLGWDTVHIGAPDGHLDWTRLVDDEWLSDGIMDKMMADIQARITAEPALESTVAAAPTAFHDRRAIVAISSHKHPSKYTLAVAEKYKQLLASGRAGQFCALASVEARSSN